MNYYCLIAGLPDLHPDDSKSTLSLLELKNDFMPQLSKEDADLMKFIFSKFDNDNWLKFLQDKDAQINPLGNLSLLDYEQLSDLMNEVEQPNDKRLLSYIHTYFTTYNLENYLPEGVSHEDYLASLYYEYAIQNKNQFLKNWFEFNLNINNILTAVACRKYDYNLRTYVLGKNEIAQTIRSSNARDFGLSGIFEQLEEVLRIADEPDLLEREKKIDALKWAWLDENTFFNYFGIEKVLSFVLKSEIIERWKGLSVEKGTQIFREILGTLKEGVAFEE